MAIKEALLAEYDHEMGTTRTLLERVPEADLAWKPHEKSMSLARLAGHLAQIPTWAGAIINQPFYDLAAGEGEAERPEPTSRREVVSAFDGAVATARALLDSKSDAELLAPWSLKRGGQDMFTMPRIAALRSFLINHSIHHRGQLSVYLRLRNVPIPAIYGPSADEGM